MAYTSKFTLKRRGDCAGRLRELNPGESVDLRNANIFTVRTTVARLRKENCGSYTIRQPKDDSIVVSRIL